MLVFDTNVLFGLYRYSQETSDELLALFKKLNSRLFLPNQVALEYHRNRTEIIGQQFKIYKAFIAEVDRAFNKIKGDLKSKRHPFIKNTDQILAEFDKLFSVLSEQIRERQNSIEKMLSDDRILADLTKLFTNKVGKKYSRDELERIYSEGDKRYHLKIPPGYSDEKSLKSKNTGT